MDSGNAELEENSMEDKEAECSEPPISIVEKKRGMYDSPVLLLSEKEEKRIHKPWKKGTIVKLLGRKIGYKVLESRLKQIIDLGNEFFLVNFSNEDDHKFALTKGP